MVDNAFNPTGAKEHDTFVVQPDPELVYKLRPGAAAEGYVLKARGPMNLDPPLVHLEPGDWISAELRSYLDERTRVQFSFSIDANGLRRTLPEVESDRRILMVGDSALFGTGVDDEQTIASHLQSLVGSSYQVVNAGVGGYQRSSGLSGGPEAGS